MREQHLIGIVLRALGVRLGKEGGEIFCFSETCSEQPIFSDTGAFRERKCVLRDEISGLEPGDDRGCGLNECCNNSATTEKLAASP